jgi:hypothetical protein
MIVPWHPEGPLAFWMLVGASGKPIGWTPNKSIEISGRSISSKKTKFGLDQIIL